MVLALGAVSDYCMAGCFGYTIGVISMNRTGGLWPWFIMAWTVSFFVCRVQNIIDWPWVWVFAPLWMSASMLVVLAVVGLAMMSKSKADK